MAHYCEPSIEAVGERRREPWVRRIMVGCMLFLAAAACGSDGGDGDGIDIVATTSILGDITREVVGQDAVVEVLIPQGADPHDYQASARQLALVAEADLVVANGLGLEEGLENVLQGAESDGVPVLRVGDSVEPIEDDPHFWLDPRRVADAARFIAGELGIIDAAIDWQARAEVYVSELEALDAAIVETLEPISPDRRKLVTNHEALTYFATRYGFEVVGVVIPGGSTLGEPSSEDLAALVRVIEEEQVPAIFGETTEPSTLAETVAAEVGHPVEVVELYTESLGEEGSAASTLIGMLESNARLIANALES